MSANLRVPLDPVADLRRRLAQRSRRRLRGCVHTWWADHGLADHPAVVGKRIAFALIEQKRADDKRAGILVLHELLLDHLRAADLAAFERVLRGGHVAGTELVDALAQVLGAMLASGRDRGELARGLARWRAGETAWQRRAACLALAALAPQGDGALPGLCELIFGLAATVVWSPERDDQTAVGWLLRELSRAEPARVETFFRRHARFMSRECARAAVGKLPGARRQELLAYHRRATTLRRR